MAGLLGPEPQVSSSELQLLILYWGEGSHREMAIRGPSKRKQHRPRRVRAQGSSLQKARPRMARGPGGGGLQAAGESPGGGSRWDPRYRQEGDEERRNKLR